MKETLQSLRRELQRMSAQLELQHRHIAVLEQRLRQTLASGTPERNSCEASMPAMARPPATDVPDARPARPNPAIWPVRTDDPDPLIPKPGFESFALKGTSQRVIGISVCGFDRAGLENVIATVERQQARKRDFVPVFLTDSNEFDLFRNRGYVFEYLPPPTRRRIVGATAWPHYSAERLELLRRKWGFAEVIEFGKHAFGRMPDETAMPDQPAQLEPPARAAASGARASVAGAAPQPAKGKRRARPRRVNGARNAVGRSRKASKPKGRGHSGA